MITIRASLDRFAGPALERMANSRPKNAKRYWAQWSGATNLVCNQAADRNREASRVRKALT